MLQNLLAPLQSINEAKTLSDPDYTPDVLTHVTAINWLGQADIRVQIYLPGLITEDGSTCTIHSSQVQRHQVQVKVGYGQWQDLHPLAHNPAYWVTDLSSVAAGTPLQFRWCLGDDEWQAIAPLTALERVYETTYVPHLGYQWRHDPPVFNQGRVIMETTLEGLLKGYADGILAPRNREEMFLNPVAFNMVKTDIPGLLSEWGIDELMITTTSSMADRAHLDPRFNYLTYDVADVDWQVGRTQDFMRLVDELYQYGLSIIPDLPIPHHVFNPFDGSLDQIRRPDNGELIYVDPEAQQFRNHGTWMFKLDDPEIRKQIVAKVVYFVRCFRLRTIRLSYLDGLMLQYAQRNLNYGAMLLRELRTALKQHVPNLLILGEATETAHYSTIEECIDIDCAPEGFPMVEELCKPPDLCDRPLFPTIAPIVQQIRRTASRQRREAFYALLHDEICSNDYTAIARADVPWAHGQNPAQLAKTKGDALVAAGQLPLQELLNYVRRTVRAMEALTMFSSRLMYMFVPAVDALSLGGLHTPDNWKVQWKGVTPEQLAIWQSTGLSKRKVFLLHQQHRAEMVALRNLFRCYTPVDPETLMPVVQIYVCHVDPINAVIGLMRVDPNRRDRTLFILMNLGNHGFEGNPNIYEVPAPSHYVGTWTVLFDGEWIAPEHRTGDESSFGYAPGSQVTTTLGQFLKGVEVLTLNLAARSILVLQHKP